MEQLFGILFKEKVNMQNKVLTLNKVKSNGINIMSR